MTYLFDLQDGMTQNDENYWMWTAKDDGNELQNKSKWYHILLLVHWNLSHCIQLCNARPNCHGPRVTEQCQVCLWQYKGALFTYMTHYHAVLSEKQIACLQMFTHCWGSIPLTLSGCPRREQCWCPGRLWRGCGLPKWPWCLSRRSKPNHHVSQSFSPKTTPPPPLGWGRCMCWPGTQLSDSATVTTEQTQKEPCW